MDKDKIKSDFPSICYNCTRARRPSADSLTEKGYVGCCLRVETPAKDHWEVTEGEEIGEGWVDLRSSVFGKSSGMLTNLQLLTKGIKKCNSFINNND